MRRKLNLLPGSGATIRPASHLFGVTSGTGMIASASRTFAVSVFFLRGSRFRRDRCNFSNKFNKSTFPTFFLKSLVLAFSVLIFKICFLPPSLKSLLWKFSLCFWQDISRVATFFVIFLFPKVNKIKVSKETLDNVPSLNGGCSAWITVN